jgi:hypothetical protein
MEKVFLTPDKTVRLIRKELGNYISSKIINAPKPSMIPGLEVIVNELISNFLKKTYTNLYHNYWRISSLHKTCN